MTTKKLSDLPAAAPILGTETVFGLQSGFSVQIPYGSFKDITISGANNTATGGGQLYLNGATGNRIDFSSAGVAPPAFSTRSVGTKIVLYPGIAAAAVDFAMGMESNTLWTSVPNTASGYKWYGGTTLAASLLGTGDLNIAGSVGVGGATASTSGTGITFPATFTNSTNANTLDDYEEGTYTPVLSYASGAATVTYDANLGNYTKIGNLVTVQARIDLATWAIDTASGQLRVSLPTSVGSVGNIAYFVSTVYGSGFTGSQPMLALAINNTAYCNLYSTTTTGTRAPVTASQVAVTSVFYMSITYTV